MCAVMSVAVPVMSEPRRSEDTPDPSSVAAKGVDVALARAALAGDEASELAAALVLAHRRRIGPFRSGDAPHEAGRQRELGVLARAGFPHWVAREALAMDLDQAETLVNRLRR